MAKSFAQRFKEAQRPEIDKPAFEAAEEEMKALEVARGSLAALLTYEGAYENSWDFGTRLGDGKATATLTKLSFLSLPASAPVAVLCQTSEYDPFNSLFLENKEANYHCAVRAHYEEANEYGPYDAWVVWALEGNTLIRAEAVGRLAALRCAYPDALSKVIMEVAGVSLSTLTTPLLIAREAALNDNL